MLSLYAASLCLMAQAPPRPAVPATPVAPSTSVAPVAPAAPAAPATQGVVGTDGSITFPLQVSPPAAIIPADRVVIQVGDIKLTSLQMGQILDAYQENQRVFANGPGRSQFVDQVVRVLLLAEEGRQRKLTETDAYKIQLMYSSAGLLATQVDAAIKQQVAGDEAELRAYYEAHKSEHEQVHARHILIRAQGSPLALVPGQTDLTDAEALAKAQQIRQKLADGADFAELARTESNDVGTAAKGGDMGFLKRGQTVPSFEEAAFALPDGGLSQPVKTLYGYHLIRVEGRKPTWTFEEMRSQVEKSAGTEASRKFVESLKAKTKIVIDPDFAATPKGLIAPKP